MERRKFPRYDVWLKIQAAQKNKEVVSGQVKNFSREGFRVIFDNPGLESDSAMNFIINRPNSDCCVSANAEAVWKRPMGEGWDVGFRLKDIPPENKAEILEYGYRKWVRDKKEAK